MQSDLDYRTKSSYIKHLYNPVLLTALCSVLLLMVPVSGLAQPAQSKPDERNELVAFLSLRSVTSRFVAASRDVKRSTATTPKAQNVPPVTEQASPAAVKEKYLALYNALGALNDSRGAYLEALRLYVDGRTRNIPYDQKRTRRDSLQTQLETLKRNLNALREAFQPLRASMDSSTPDVSLPIEDYIQERGAKAARADVADTLSHQELQDLYKQAVQNNVRLQQAIGGLLGLIKKKYPDV